MKKQLFGIMALAAAALVGFTACNKDNGETPAATGNNVLMVKLPDNIVTRAVETPVTGANITSVLDDVTVYLLNNGGLILDTKTFTAQQRTDKYARFEQVSSAVTKVLVLANTPTDATLTGLNNAAAIKQYAYTSASQNLAAKTGVNGQLLMGEANVNMSAADPATDGHAYGEAEVTLNALTARMEIGAVKAGEGITSIELVGIWVNNYFPTYDYTFATASAKLHAADDAKWITTPLTSTSPSATAADFASVSVPAYTLAHYYNAAANTNVKLDASTMAYSYQVFAGNVPHVILLVKGEYASGYYADGKKYFLGYVTFNKYNAGAVTAFQPNYIYKMGVDENGIEIKAEYITPKPEMSKYDLGVKIVVTEWTIQNVTPGV